MMNFLTRTRFLLVWFMLYSTILSYGKSNGTHRMERCVV